MVFFSTGLSDPHSHDAQIGCFVTNGDDDLVRVKLNLDTSLIFDDPARRLAVDAEHVILLATLALPHSEGEIVLASADPSVRTIARIKLQSSSEDVSGRRMSQSVAGI